LEVSNLLCKIAAVRNYDVEGYDAFEMGKTTLALLSLDSKTESSSKLLELVNENF
jgi:hypothetical protein